MTNAAVHCDHVSRQELDCSVVEIDKETAFEREETLIRVGMAMPVVILGHGADANFMIIYRRNRMVVVAVRR